MCPSLVTVIVTAPHHPQNQGSWHNVCANMTVARQCVTERLRGSSLLWIKWGTLKTAVMEQTGHLVRVTDMWSGLPICLFSFPERLLQMTLFWVSYQAHHCLWKLCNSPWYKSLSIFMHRVFLFVLGVLFYGLGFFCFVLFFRFCFVLFLAIQGK